jgi:hypothetical protein
MAYEDFYSAYSSDPHNFFSCYVFRNKVFEGQGISENFFGRAFYDNHSNRIRSLKVSDMFQGDSFRPLADFATIGLPISAAMWFRLQNIIIPVFRRLRNQTLITDPERVGTIEKFFSSFKKGSKKF